MFWLNMQLCTRSDGSLSTYSENSEDGHIEWCCKHRKGDGRLDSKWNTVSNLNATSLGWLDMSRDTKVHFYIKAQDIYSKKVDCTRKASAWESQKGMYVSHLCAVQTWQFLFGVQNPNKSASTKWCECVRDAFDAEQALSQTWVLESTLSSLKPFLSVRMFT